MIHGYPSFFWLAVAAILVLALVLRWARVDALEPFIDEGANTLSSLDETVRHAFNPVAQGRPLVAWMFRPAEFLPFTTITNARVVVALTGAATVALLGLGLALSAGRRAALLGMGLWATLPIVVFHERLVLQDPAIAALMAAEFALMALYARTAQPGRRSALAFGGGFLFGTALLVKLSAALALPWIGLAFVGLQLQAGRPVFERRCWLIAVGVAVPFLLLGSDLARLGGRLTELGSVPNYNAASNKLALFGAMVAEAKTRVPLFASWYAGYGGVALLALLAAAAFGLFKSGSLARWLALGWVLTFLGACLIYHLPYARYLVPDHIPLVLFIAVVLGTLTIRWQNIAASALVVLTLGWWVRTDLQIIRDPATARIPQVDVIQYVTGFWSGNGVRRLEAFLDDHSEKQKQPCLVIAHTHFRPGCYGLLLAARENPNFKVVRCYQNPNELADIGAVVASATKSFGLEPAVFVLDEMSSPEVVNALRAAGADEAPAFDLVRANGADRFTLYRYRDKP